MKRLLGICLSLCTLLLAAEESLETLASQGNWKELRTAAERVLDTLSPGENDTAAANAWTKLQQALNNGNMVDDYDAAFDKYVAKKFLKTPAVVIETLYMMNRGYLLNGTFHRGYNRGNAGRYADCMDRDRVQLLQILSENLEKAGDNVKFYEFFASKLLQDRSDNQSFQLQTLTDLKNLPDYRLSEERVYSSSRPPVNPDGTPVFYKVPKSFEDAANDGERYRFVADRAISLGSRPAMIEYANFLISQFDFMTIDFQQRNEYYQVPALKEFLYNLKDTETVAELADGVRLIQLPEDARYMTILEKAEDWDTLGQICLSRMQFERAAEYFRKSETSKHLADEIEGVFGGCNSVESATVGAELKLCYQFRNAEKLRVQIFPVDSGKAVEQLLENMRKNEDRWESRELFQLPVARRNWPKWNEVISKTPEKEYVLDLNPLKHHWTTETFVPVPTDKAGAMIVVLTPGTADGKFAEQSVCEQLVWIADRRLTAVNGTAENCYLLNEPVSGEPVVQAKLTRYLYFFNSKEKKVREEVLSVTTDENGAAVFPEIKAPKGCYFSSGYLIDESVPGKRTLLQDISFWHNDARFPDRARWILLPDRPIYKPGDTIAVTGYYRKPSYAGKTEKLEKNSVKLVFRDPRGESVVEETVPFDKETQSFTLETKIPESARLGNWQIVVEQTCSTIVSVEEYKKPEYLLKVLPPEKPIAAGEKLPVRFQADYYFGAPVADAEIKVRIFREETVQPYPFVFLWDWLYGRGCAICSTAFQDKMVRTVNYGRVMVLETTLKTDSAGRAEVTLDTADAVKKYGSRDFRYTAEAEVTDESRRVVKGSGSVIAAAQPFRIFFSMPWGFLRTGETANITVSARTADSVAVKGFGTLRIFRRALNEQGVPQRVGAAVRSLTFEPDGPDPMQIVMNEPGVYEMEAEVVSEQGITLRESLVFPVYGEKKEGGLFGELPLTVATDKPTYQPGETAKILVSAAKPGCTVYFFTQDGKFKRVKMDGYSHLFEVPVEKDSQPNFFVNVFCVSGGQVLTQTKQILVPPEKKILNVQAEPLKNKVKPGDVIPLKITVTGLDGKPVAGCVTATVYDKSLEALAANRVPELNSYFWGWKRYNDLSFNWNRIWLSPFMEHCWNPSLEQGGYAYGVRNEVMLLGRNGVRRDRLAKGAVKMAKMTMAAGAVNECEDMACDAAPAPAMEAASANFEEGSSDAVNTTVRTDFRDRAFWIGRLQLSEKGTATVNVRVPDNLTTWAVRVWSLTSDTRVGEAVSEIVVSKDLIVRLEIPRFMVQGDVVSAVAVVHNYSEKKIAPEIQLTASGLLDEPFVKKAEIASGAKHSFEIPLKAGKSGNFKLVLSAKTAADFDAVRLEIPVLVKGFDKEVHACGKMSPDAAEQKITLTLPEERREGSEAFELYLSPGAAKNMVEILPYLAAEDSSDVFCTVNRFLPALSAKIALQKIGVPWKNIQPEKTDRDPLYREYMDRVPNAGASFSAEKFDKVISDNLAMVLKGVNSDGGWGWFSGRGSQSFPDTTAYVVDALLDLQQADVPEIPANAVKRGVAWLEEHAAERLRKILAEESNVYNTDAFVLRVLAKAGKPNRELMAVCYNQRVEHLAPYGLAMLALAYEPESEEAAMLQRNLEQFLRKDEENQTAWLEIPSSCCFFWYGNENETLSAYLELLLRKDPAGITAQEIAKYLVTNIRNSPWRNSTRSLGAAVRSLAKYLTVSRETAPDFTVTAEYGSEKASFRFTAENMWKTQGPALLIPAAKLKNGMEIKLTFSGTGVLYWNSTLRCFSTEDEVREEGLEMRIRRNYYRMVPEQGAFVNLAGIFGAPQKEKVLRYKRRELSEDDEIHPGDLIEVELISTAKNDYDYVVFEDAMPAGFEFEHPVSGYQWLGGAPVYAEYKERGARFYLRNMARGKSNVFYRIRAQLNGTVTSMPAIGRGVYAPELKCNSDSFKFNTVK